MDKNKKIRIMVSELESICNEYLIYCDGFNESAFSDKILEKLLNRAEMINRVRNGSFDIKKANLIVREVLKNGS